MAYVFSELSLEALTLTVLIYQTMNKNTTENITLDIKRQTHSFIQGAVLAAIVLPGIVGNVFALIVTTRLLKLREHRLSPNVFAFGLTAIDLFAVVGISAPSLIGYVAGEWIGGAPLCKFQGFVALFCSLASGGVAVSMAVERYISVASPLRYRTRISANLAKKVIVAIVAGTAILSLMPIGGIGSFVKAASGTFCTFDWFARRLEDIVYSYIIVIYSTISIVTLVFCNINISFKLFQSTRVRQRTLSEVGSAKVITLSSIRKTIEWQFGKMMFFISAIFLLCWIPFTVRMVCNLAGVWLSENVDIQVSRLALLNFVFDPFTYVLTRPQYRHALREMCSRR